MLIEQQQTDSVSREPSSLGEAGGGRHLHLVLKLEKREDRKETRSWRVPSTLSRAIKVGGRGGASCY